MRKIGSGLPSPALAVSILALIAAIAGPAVAGEKATTSAVSAKKVKKLARTQANKQISKRARGLTVGNARRLGGKRARAFASAESEAYREIGAPGEPPFRNGWANAGPGSGFSTAGFYKDPLGAVHLKGNVSNPSDATAAFTLPPGYRPAQHLFMPMASGPFLGPGALVVESDGDVIPDCEGMDSCIAGIDGLTFRAAG